MAHQKIGVGRWMAVVAVGLMVLAFVATPEANGATSVVPCPKASVPLTGSTSMAGSAPSPLNPCPGWEWAKTYGMPGFNDNANSLDVTSDGGVVVSVHTTGSPGVTVLKLDTNGSMEWQKEFNPGAAGRVRQTSDGGYALATWMGGVIVYRLDALGNVVWQKAFDGPGNDVVSSIEETADGGYVVGGYTDSATDAWVLRLDAAGEVLWQKTYGGPNGETARGVRPTPDGGFVLGGSADSIRAAGAWVLKLDSAGNIVWQKRYDQRTSLLGSIQVTSDGGSVFMAVINEKFGVVKLTAMGSIAWQKTYGDRGAIGSVWQTADGGYLVSQSAPTQDGIDVMVLRLDTNGNRLWQRTYGGPLGDQVCFPDCIQEAPDGTILVAGSTQSFGTDAATGGSDAWVIRLFSDGTISSTCAPGFGTGVSPSTVSGSKLKTGNPAFVSSTWSATLSDPTTTVVPGSFVTMTQCSA